LTVARASGTAIAMPKPKRVHLGNDVWETRLPDGDTLIEIGCTEEEAAALDTDAEAAGLTVSDLMKMRCLGKHDEIEMLTQAREIETMKRSLDSMTQQNWILQEALEIRSRRNLPITDPNLFEVLSAAMPQFKAILQRLTTVENSARKSEFHDLLARIAALKAAILKNIDLVSENLNIAA
jgi:hypothetical protein